MEDMRQAAGVLRNRKIAPGVVLKIVPATDRIWQQCLEEGLIEIFKESGALVSNAGCAGCAAGQVGQNGPGEVTVSTGNRNFPGKQGLGDVYLASPEVVAASAVAGFITASGGIPKKVVPRVVPGAGRSVLKVTREAASKNRVREVTGKVWFIPVDDIDTDMIFHNRYLSVTDPAEMGPYAFGNLSGFEDFAKKAGQGDIIVAGKNFGAGSSRQQAVDCFVSLGIGCLLAESFGAIYERNAINAAFPIMPTGSISQLGIETGHELTVNFETGRIHNHQTGKTVVAAPFSEVQMEIYQNNGLF
jgi:3-isopropylmalate dehydratase small subunit